MPYDVDIFKNSYINITGFQILDRECREYEHLKASFFYHNLREF